MVVGFATPALSFCSVILINWTWAENLCPFSTFLHFGPLLQCPITWWKVLPGTHTKVQTVSQVMKNEQLHTFLAEMQWKLSQPPGSQILIIRPQFCTNLMSQLTQKVESIFHPDLNFYLHLFQLGKLTSILVAEKPPIFWVVNGTQNVPYSKINHMGSHRFNWDLQFQK